jgi:fructose-1,6-bisphosphatase II
MSTSLRPPTRNLALELVRATEAAALKSAQWVGRGDKNAGDGAAVEAMRLVLNSIPMDGEVIIGEGEKDEAPMLYSGERVGTPPGPEVDLAIDPVEGTSLLALGRPGAIAVVAAAPKGTMLDTGAGFYAAKIVVGAGAKDAIDLNAATADNLQEIAYALRKKLSQITVFVLGKPRHDRLIDDIRHAGARVTVQPEGDVAGGIAAALPDTGVDVMMGTGGTPEGIITAAAVQALGGNMLMRLDPQQEEEKANLLAAGYDLGRIYRLDELCSSDQTHFAATGITDGPMLRGVRYSSIGAVTHSLVIRGQTRTLRFVESHHHLDKLKAISDVDY